MRRFLSLLSIVGALLPSAAALCGSLATAEIDLNVRAGPGARHEKIGVVPAGAGVIVKYCRADPGWCAIDYSGQSGWIYSERLRKGSEASGAKAATPAEAVAPTNPGVDTMSTSSVAAMGAPASIALPDTVRKYVSTHRPLPIEFDGEPEVGAILPEGARLLDVPGFPYRYAYVKDRPVFVDGLTRRIVHIEQ